MLKKTDHHAQRHTDDHAARAYAALLSRSSDPDTLDDMRAAFEIDQPGGGGDDATY